MNEKGRSCYHPDIGSSGESFRNERLEENNKFMVPTGYHGNQMHNYAREPATLHATPNHVNLHIGNQQMVNRHTRGKDPVQDHLTTRIGQ